MSGFLLLRKSGLFQIGVRLDGERIEFVILWNFHQADRAEDIVVTLKHGWRLIDWLINGISEIRMSLQKVCSMSNQVLSEGLGCVHL